MQAALVNALLSKFYGSFELPYTGSIPDWLHTFVRLEGNSKFDIGVCPWLREIYEAIADPEIDIVVIEGAAGTYKTGVIDTLIPYWAINDSGKVLRIHHRDEVATDFIKTRLLPMLEQCAPVKSLFGSNKIRFTNNMILFPHMDVKACGPSEKIQHGYSCKYLQLDEAHLIEDSFDKLFTRVRKNYARTKIVVSSTPGEQKFKNDELIGDELAILVNSGVIYRRAWQCPQCSQYQVWRWSAKRSDGKTYSGINWGKEIRTAEGNVDIEKTSDNAKLECHHCTHLVEDTAENRILLEQTARYECIKSNGNKRIKVFQFPAWVAPHNTFKDSCIRYIKAKEQADARIYEKLKEFYQQVAGEEWTNKIVKTKNKLTYTRFDSNAAWPEEKFRFMAVDLQGDGRRYYMIVAFDSVGNGRLINYGVARSWLEIEQLAVKYKVQKPDGENAHFVGVDCGYDWKEVAKETVRHGVDKEFEEGGHRWKERFGWLCLRGEQKDSFNWDDGIKRNVSPQQWYETSPDDPPARVHYWSNKSMKNLVASIRDGHNKLKLEINTQDDNLHRQLNSEYPDANGDWKESTKENHLWDAVLMTYVMGTLAGLPFLGTDTAVKT